RRSRVSGRDAGELAGVRRHRAGRGDRRRLASPSQGTGASTGKDTPMSRRILVTGATGKIGGAVAVQLLEQGVTIRAMVHREDARSTRLREMGAEVVIADMFDIQQVTDAMAGVDRLYFNPPYHPHALDSAVAFAVAAQRVGVEAVVALGQWLASPEHPSLMTRHAWLTDKLFELLPDTAHVAVDPGYFADN